jgi:hypothetical protein
MANERETRQNKAAAEQSVSRPRKRRKEGDVASTPSNGASTPEVFAQAYREFVQALQEAWTDDGLRSRAEEAYRAYGDATQQGQSLPAEALDRVTSAYAAMLRGVSEASSPFDAQQRAADPYRQMMETLGEAASGSQERLRSAWREVAQVWQEAPERLADRSEKAYADYVGQLKRACSQFDASSLTPEALSAIGQSLVAAAAARAAAVQAVEQARMAGAAMAPQGG